MTQEEAMLRIAERIGLQAEEKAKRLIDHKAHRTLARNVVKLTLSGAYPEKYLEDAAIPWFDYGAFQDAMEDVIATEGEQLKAEGFVGLMAKARKDPPSPGGESFDGGSGTT